ELLQGCGGSTTAPSNIPQLSTIAGGVSGRTVTVTVDAASPLSGVGNAVIVSNALGAFLVSRTGQTTFSVLTATCTHEGCAVTGFQNAKYVCPCHGSQFNTTGAVLSGPASLPLRQFASQFNDPTL